MKSSFVILMLVCFSVLVMHGQPKAIVVADSIYRTPLPGASVLNNDGHPIAISDHNGRISGLATADLPITVRYLGFRQKTVKSLAADTVFLSELTTSLNEVVVESRLQKILHVLAYVREYSTLTDFNDSIFLFREKMVDFMIPPHNKVKFKGWNSPRVLKSESYYRFTNSQGLDSVSNRCNHHFSWSDWIGIIPPPKLPSKLCNTAFAADTVMGKYSPTEIWSKNDDLVNIDINVLADTTSRKWVHNLSLFFRNNLDFENFRLHYSYRNVIADSIAATDLKAYSFSIESNGRGREMFRFNKKEAPFFVSTYGEVYILDKDYITIKEAKKWSDIKFRISDLHIIEPVDAPPLQQSVQTLITRVNAIDHDDVRLDFAPDKRLVGRKVKPQNIGQRALSLLKDMTGISSFISHRKQNRNWKDFRNKQKQPLQIKKLETPQPE